ncbi:LOW QUALITY PROTEIN: purine nucleoside phosphorylase-like [Uloborus diversus]|uniref:LOW QUALITY PROTEIN: purine nucleoside phosphorylase-like n=1 Tax=Uloborus diversus TaxID=327109 RepID=UPI00240A355C|nr:LOW QUALITY PROTEIN: purine nucleoside phosphorylase-like [Uloborus diversus]
MIEIKRGMTLDAESDGSVREDGSMYSYESMQSLTQYLLDRTKHRPSVGVICGSGMGGLADMLEDNESFAYNEIPGFPTSTVAGHKGRLVFGILNGVPTVCMQGRFHVYEGYSLWKCAMPVRVMKLIGVKTLIVTNAAGGLNSDFRAGDIMIIKDHINFPGFAGDNPLRGRNDERWGPRFPAINNAYDLKLRKIAREIAEDLGFGEHITEGVYAMVGGPCYETVSELRALKILGADAVGMSTAHEVIAAKHCGLRVFGLSLITNECVMEYDVERSANHAEVLETSNRRKADLEKLITNLVARIQE